MKNPVILHIETATNVCSVALSVGKEVVAERLSREDRSHGTVLTLFIQEVLDDASKKPEEIDAIAVSKGPGSYTGLRIGVSVTKGFAYARDIPVIGINTLTALAAGALIDPKVSELIEKNQETAICPMLDARRMEVYCSVYNPALEVIQPVNAVIINENSFSEILKDRPVIFFGNGSFKIKDVVNSPNAHIIDQIEANAAHMITLVLQAWEKRDFENTAYFEPFYLKDFVATTPKRKVL